nr:MAG TPA: hypothetical protein [Caudoviricetes sp.]
MRYKYITKNTKAISIQCVILLYHHLKDHWLFFVLLE